MISRYRKWVLGLLLFAGLLMGCQDQSILDPTVSPTAGAAPTHTEEALVDTPLVNITAVTVEAGQVVTFSGRTSVSDGECLYSQLYADEVVLDWWPVGKCFPVSGMDWTFSVPLGVEGAPEDLDAAAAYRLRVWWPGAPEVANSNFYFDLSAPPNDF